MVHVTVGTGPPDEVQEMLTLRPSKIAKVSVLVAVLGDAKCKYHRINAHIL